MKLECLPPELYILEVSFAKADIKLGACFNSIARAIVTKKKHSQGF